MDGLLGSWGEAWIGALEGGAVPDPSGLSAGRTDAKKRSVTMLELAPGVARARVGDDAVQLGVRQLSDAAWHDVFAFAIGRPAVAAGLLAGAVPDALQILLLPGSGDVSAECSCSAWAEPCRHAAALCHHLGDLMDDDGFVLTQLRGRSRSDILDAIRVRRAESSGTELRVESGEPRGADPGTSASAAWRRDPPPMPAPLRLGREPGGLRPLAAAPPADSGIPLTELQELVADAAQRAFAMLAGESTSGLDLSVGSDVARRAVDGDIDRIAETTRLDRTELAAAAEAWRFGGAAGLAVARRQMDAANRLMTPGIAALGAGAKVRGNRVSEGTLQLRRDEDGMWWRFQADDELGWVLVSEAAADPAELLD